MPTTDPPSSTNIVAGESGPDLEPLGEASTDAPPAPSGRFGRGWKLDAHDSRDRPAQRRLGAARALPPEDLGLVAFLRGIKDQKGTEACVPHATGTIVDTRLRKLGYNPPDNSRLALFAATHGIEKKSPTAPLVNEGVFPRDTVTAAARYGIVAESLWPFDEAKATVQPPWDVAQAASVVRITEFFRIVSSGKGRSDDIANAVRQGFPVMFGSVVGDGFQAYDGKGACKLTDPNGGGHMLSILGYTMVSGERWFRGVNSWGEGWGDKGLFWARESEVTSNLCSDFYICEVAVAAELPEVTT